MIVMKFGGSSVKDAASIDRVIKIIQNGKAPPVEDPKKPVPPLYMPSWKNVLSEEDINRVADYLWSLQKKAEAW